MRWGLELQLEFGSGLGLSMHWLRLGLEEYIVTQAPVCVYVCLCVRLDIFVGTFYVENPIVVVTTSLAGTFCKFPFEGKIV